MFIVDSFSKNQIKIESKLLQEPHHASWSSFEILTVLLISKAGAGKIWSLVKSSCKLILVQTVSKRIAIFFLRIIIKNNDYVYDRGS